MRQTQNTKKDNRKSIFVIALLLLLVAVIGFGGYTMSKYISSKTEKSSASVAKWGFTVSTKTNKLFGEKYVAGLIPETTATGATLSAKADSTGRKIVAPGHSGYMTFEIKAEKASEVRAQIQVSVKEEYKDIVLVYQDAEGEKSYNPVRWTLKKGGVAAEADKNLTLAQLADKLNALTETVEAGAEIKDVAGEYTIEWAWAFESGNDALDTLFGAYANDNKVTSDGTYTVITGTDKTSTDISFEITISVTQLQK